MIVCFDADELDDLGWSSVLVDAGQFVEDGKVSKVPCADQKLGENLEQEEAGNKETNRNLWSAESVAFEEEVGKAGEALSGGRGGHVKLVCALHVELGRAEAEVVEMQAVLPQHCQVQPIIGGIVQ